MGAAMRCTTSCSLHHHRMKIANLLVLAICARSRDFGHTRMVIKDFVGQRLMRRSVMVRP